MLFGKKCCLRRPEREDYSLLLTWWNDPHIQKYMDRQNFPVTFNIIENYYHKCSSYDREIFMIHSFDGKTIGNTELSNIDWKNKKGSLEILIGEKDYEGKGYGTDSLKTFLIFLFNELQFERIESKLIEYNEKAIKCFLKCGFQIEGTLRKSVYQNGSYHNQLIMSILYEDFNK